MKTKAKLTLGVGVLFLLIVLQALVSAWQVFQLSFATKNILKDNYISIGYARAMLDDLEKSKTLDQPNWDVFEKNLQDQEKNITEIGEGELTTALRESFTRLARNPADSAAEKGIRKYISGIMQLNLEAIERKSSSAEVTAENTILVISVIGTICFLIAFTLLFNLPHNIANPIRTLTDSIKQIADGNYEQQVHFKSNNEFGELANSFNIMAAKLQEYNSSNLAKLMTEKRRIETLINNMHDPVIGLDENQKIIFINTEALNICGLKQETTIGRSVKELAHANDLIRALTSNSSEITVKAGQGNPAIRIYADGKESYFEKETLDITVAQTGDQLPRQLGHVILLRNITPYKELDLAKTHFIATISHEFKTPITSIKMSLQLLEDERTGGNLNTEQQSLVQNIKEDAERLLKITRELLDMAQVESGKIQLSIQPADPKTIFQRAIEATHNQADQKQVKLQLGIQSDTTAVLADADKTVWVLTNLITNAIRYSYQNGTVNLLVKADKQQVHFVVQDFGQGMESQYKEKIFDRFFRIPGAQQEGTGLGLAISKEFIEAQGGTIQLESEYGAGTTFTVSLPLAS